MTLIGRINPPDNGLHWGQNGVTDHREKLNSWSKIWSYGFHLRKSEKKVEVEMDGEQAERVLQMVRVLGSLLVTKLLSNVQRGENDD